TETHAGAGLVAAERLAVVPRRGGVEEDDGSQAHEVEPPIREDAIVEVGVQDALAGQRAGPVAAQPVVTAEVVPHFRALAHECTRTGPPRERLARLRACEPVGFETEPGVDEVAVRPERVLAQAYAGERTVAEEAGDSGVGTRERAILSCAERLQIGAGA